MSSNRGRTESRRGYDQRRVNTRPLRTRFLIVCEGEKTEPGYFKSFRVSKAVVDIRGLGYNTRSLVEKTIEISNTGQYDQVWCVMDKDSFSDEIFNAALQLAKNNDIQVAYSNEAFELWYLLHFHYYNTGITRQQYIDKLDGLLGSPYRKNRPDMYDLLTTLQRDAIRNAENLLATYVPSQPARDNPSTTVHLLVQELNKHSV
ncbi:MAG: RloB family protein [Candidatus Hydrogenedentes bacterium]|nr:RloB family protein [Candidatus Hydrogenedentota bacterium]